MNYTQTSEKGYGSLNGRHQMVRYMKRFFNDHIQNKYKKKNNTNFIF